MATKMTGREVLKELGIEAKVTNCGQFEGQYYYLAYDVETLFEKAVKVGYSDTTHAAYLIGIRPIKPACSKHEPEIHGGEYQSEFIWANKLRCKHCGAKIVATEWRGE